MTIDYWLARIPRRDLPRVAELLLSRRLQVYRCRGDGRTWRIHPTLDGYTSKEAAEAGWQELTTKVALRLMRDET